MSHPIPERIARRLIDNEPVDWDRRRYEIDDNGCWIWSLATVNGYGSISWVADGKAFAMKAHQMSYILAKGEVPDGLELDHLCRVPLCINPDHLEPVTHLENIRRGNVLQTHCKRGHPFDEVNTKHYRGKRICLTCRKLHMRAFS